MKYYSSEKSTSFTLTDSLLLQYSPTQSSSQPILIHQGLVDFFKEFQISYLLPINTLSSESMVLGITPSELYQAEVGKHYLPEAIFTVPQLKWAVYTDSDDYFHMREADRFVKRFILFMKNHVRP